MALVDVSDHYQVGLLETMQAVARQRRQHLWLVGGTVRDCLLGRIPKDLDCVVESDAAGLLRQVARRWGAGSLVRLGTPEDDTCRLALPGLDIDVAGFRAGAVAIEDDLRHRDITMNALAVRLDELLLASTAVVIDPLGGLQDLRRGIIRCCPGAFAADPLRMLRVFRFAAQFDFTVEKRTRAAIAPLAAAINHCATERIAYECEQMMATPRAAAAFGDLASSGLLGQVAPELWLGSGVDQPPCHHLDVLSHNLETLACLEGVLAEPALFFPDSSEPLIAYGSDPENRSVLKWAALFHDVGKPIVRAVASGNKQRITFYRHDERGASLFAGFAGRMHWNRRRMRRVAALIAMHMHPFHLCNVSRQDGAVSRRALLKINQRAENERSGLFLLAMADSLAGQGEGKPPEMERELAVLHRLVEDFYQESIRPVLAGPKLLTGNDLIATLGLKPGPLFRELLDGVETAAVEGTVKTRDDALQWVRGYLVTGNNRERM